ncbi:HSP20-like chaperone [Schizophyllum commune]|nr:HSP20-like chaperone [Schizophyllum commune Loenen D]KAI5835657.1 HSP20-like chaperone [Schizophyllum commune Tattone D]
MSLFRYEPFYDVDRIFNEFFGEAQRRRGEGASSDVVQTLKPRMDLHEDAEKNLVTATFELPGLKKEDVQVNVQNGQLTVSGETKSESDKEEQGYAVRERRYGKISRTLRLPEGVKEDEVKAALENGVLTVTFPKTGAQNTPKKITVA